MKRRKLFFLFAVILASAASIAQSIKIIHATRQDWSGGMAGYYGINYYIEFQTSSRKLYPDTLWVNEIAYPISFTDEANGCIRTFDSATHITTYAISISDAHGGDVVEDVTQQQNKPVEPKKRIPHFNGAALLSYQYRHKQYFFRVLSIQTLEPINYP